MREFFKGWRRKTGCVTLVIALMFMGAWIRTTFGSNQVHLQRVPSNYVLLSTDGYFQLTSYSSPFGSQSEIYWNSWPAGQKMGDAFSHTQIEWRWRWNGFEFGQGLLNGAEPMRVWAIPYWFIVIPLTVLSAWLLLWKVRVTIPAANQAARTTADTV